MYRSLVQDYARYGGRNGNPFGIFWKAVASDGFRAVVLYRMGHWCRRHRLRLVAAFLERLMHHLCHCWISTAAEIGEGFLVAHVSGLIIGAGTVIGRNCDVRHTVTFGGNYNKKDAEGRMFPTLGDNVSVGVGVVILGPIKVGSNSIIGANAVVTRDIPENVIVGGIPAKVIKPRWDEGERKL